MTADRETPTNGAGSFQVGPGMRVRVGYQVFDEDGEPVEDEGNELSYVHGFGAVLPGLESALEGLHAGAHRSVTLAPRDAFGPRRKEAIVEFGRDEFPETLSAGDRFEAEAEDGSVLVLRVLEVHPDSVVVDLNHPLAGQRARFELDVRDVRPATTEELAAAERQAKGDPADGPLIPATRLLRGPPRRYEMDPLPPRRSGRDDEN